MERPQSEKVGDGSKSIPSSQHRARIIINTCMSFIINQRIVCCVLSQRALGARGSLGHVGVRAACPVSNPWMAVGKTASKIQLPQTWQRKLLSDDLT